MQYIGNTIENYIKKIIIIPILYLLREAYQLTKKYMIIIQRKKKVMVIIASKPTREKKVTLVRNKRTQKGQGQVIASEFMAFVLRNPVSSCKKSWSS